MTKDLTTSPPLLSAPCRKGPVEWRESEPLEDLIWSHVANRWLAHYYAGVNCAQQLLRVTTGADFEQHICSVIRARLTQTHDSKRTNLMTVIRTRSVHCLFSALLDRSECNNSWRLFLLHDSLEVTRQSALLAFKMSQNF